MAPLLHRAAITSAFRISDQGGDAAFFSMVLATLSLYHHSQSYIHTTHHDCFTALLQDHPGEPVPKENFWTIWCKGRLTKADRPTNPAGRHSIRTNQFPPPPSPHFLQAECPSCHPTNSVKALKATSTFGLERRHQSSPQRCYLHHLRTSQSYIHKLSKYQSAAK